MAAIKKRSLVDQVYEMLRGDIITLRRPLGSKLNVNELQDELGVSCTPIREAVNRLQQEGLVVYENNVGAHILDLDQHDITEIEQLAMTLHCAAIRLAMAHGDRAAIVTGLEKYLEEYRRARNVQSEVMAVNRFVGTFYAHCGNRRLDANMISIQGQQLLLRYIYADCLTERGSHAEDFEGMLEAARRGVRPQAVSEHVYDLRLCLSGAQLLPVLAAQRRALPVLRPAVLPVRRCADGKTAPAHRPAGGRDGGRVPGEPVVLPVGRADYVNGGFHAVFLLL